ncbi:hypothetical protein HDU84_006998 [Entophlyctis sp. JEL0112]|nr:hypothetical protein HDU84_006998 [Entophlyctis sp. JEL0112]
MLEKRRNRINKELLELLASAGVDVDERVFVILSELVRMDVPPLWRRCVCGAASWCEAFGRVTLQMSLLPLPYLPAPADGMDAAPDPGIASSSPVSVSRLTSSEHLKLLSLLSADISNLLKAPAEAFEAAQNDVRDWLTNYLTVSMSAQPGEAQHPSMRKKESVLRRKVFALIHRTIETNPLLLDLPLWIAVCRVFGPTNSAALGPLWLILESPLNTEVDAAVELFISSVRAAQRRIEKSSSGSNASKGKGSSGSKSSPGQIDESTEKKHIADIQLLSDALESFDSIVFASCFATIRLSDKMMRSRELLFAIVACYEIANIIAISNAQPLVETDTPTPSSEFIFSEDNTLASIESKLNFQLRRFKQLTLSFLDLLFTVSVFNALNVPPSSENATGRMFQPPILPANEQADRIELLANSLFQLLEAAPLDGPVRALVSTAPLLVDFEVETGISDSLRRVRELLANNAEVENTVLARIDFLIIVTSSSSNGKTKKSNDRKTGGLPSTDDFVNRTLLISQVQDLFPELGEGFIEACLIAMNNNSELVIMKILENDLPEHVRKLDRQMQRGIPDLHTPAIAENSVNRSKSKKNKSAQNTEPNSWPSLPVDNNVLSSRKNVFDNDEFDLFGHSANLDSSNVIWGKKQNAVSFDGQDASAKEATIALHKKKVEEEIEFERLLREESEAKDRAVYDDEYDDTYDSSDIQLAGTVELHMLDESETSVDATHIERAHADSLGVQQAEGINFIEETLFAIASGPEKSQLEVTARKNIARQRLKAKLGWSDEQIEGWYKMFLRNPTQQRKLEEKFEWRGNHTAVAVNPQYDTVPDQNDLLPDVPQRESTNPIAIETNSVRGGRGRGSGGRGRGKPNRRDQHAKKMARGMMGPE